MGPWTLGTQMVRYILRRDKETTSIFVPRGSSYHSDPGLLFPEFPTRPVAFWERVWAGGRLSAHADGGRAAGELLRGAKAVRLW